MNSRLMISDYASLIEYRLGNYDYTNLINQADIIVNPSFGSSICRSIIINLPFEIPIDILKKHNKIKSRFPIGLGIDVEEYVIPENRTKKSKKDYSLLLLNKYMLADLSKVELIDNTNFLLGTDAVIDGSLTAVGYTLLRTYIEEVS